jgi:hypothetical protein
LRTAEQQPSVDGASGEESLVVHSLCDVRRGCILGILVVFSACGGGGGESGSTPATAAVSARAVDLTDSETAQLLYSDHQRTPIGFASDPAPAYPGYVATAHLKNTDLGASATQYELCTDDWTVALTWSDQTAASLSASTLVESNFNSRYHEFIRVRSGTPQGYLRSRVYRCSYIDRSSVDLRTSTATAGQFNHRPLDASAMQALSEYLWSFTSYNNYGHAVLKSSGGSTTTGWQHTLVIASLEAGASGCDRVTVSGWTHVVTNETGALTRETSVLWEFGARRTAGLVELCNPF